MTSFLNLFLFAVQLVFGVFVSASVLDIKFNKKNILILFIVSFFLYGIQGIVFFTFDGVAVQHSYPIITHLPLILFFLIYYKRHLIYSITSVALAYFCCGIDEWVGRFFEAITGSPTIFLISRIICSIMVGIIFISYAGKYAAKLFLRSKISSITFGIIPIVYYFFDYITTTYTNLLYSGNPVASEFMPFVCCIGYLTFIIFYLKEYELKCDAERREQMIHFQYEHTASQIDDIRHSEYEMQILRHDLRHMLTNLATLMDNYDLEKSREYLNKMLDKVSSIRVHRYCENELINAVLSFYNHKCSETGNISLHIDVKIPKDLSCNDMEFSFILSNGLENAYNAASKNDSKSTISVKILVDEMNHLLLTIKNPFKEKPSFVNNLPTTSAPGHGIGSQSIKYLTEKMGGRCQFTAENNLFVLRVII